jgi:hypothetical protein
MKFLLAATIPDWHDLAPTRQTQHFCNELGKALEIVRNNVVNNGAAVGKIEWPTVTVHWELELEPSAKPADDERAA